MVQMVKVLNCDCHINLEIYALPFYLAIARHGFLFIYLLVLSFHSFFLSTFFSLCFSCQAEETVQAWHLSANVSVHSISFYLSLLTMHATKEILTHSHSMTLQSNRLLHYKKAVHLCVGESVLTCSELSKTLNELL